MQCIIDTRICNLTQWADTICTLRPKHRFIMPVSPVPNMITKYRCQHSDLFHALDLICPHSLTMNHNRAQLAAIDVRIIFHCLRVRTDKLLAGCISVAMHMNRPAIFYTAVKKCDCLFIRSQRIPTIIVRLSIRNHMIRLTQPCCFCLWRSIHRIFCSCAAKTFHILCWLIGACWQTFICKVQIWIGNHFQDILHAMFFHVMNNPRIFFRIPCFCRCCNAITGVLFLHFKEAVRQLF